MNSKPYIGITGITTLDQVQNIIRIWDSLHCESHQLMMGFLYGYKELKGISHDNPRYCIYKGVLQSYLYLCGQKNIFRVIHYNTHNPYFAQEIIENFIDEKMDMDGFQLNISNPNPTEVERLCEETQVILQINHSLLSNLGELSKYKHPSYYLIDPSGGKGKSVDFEWLDWIINKINIPLNKIGIAGGLSPDNISEFAQRYSHCSFDAESKLRTNDQLDIDKVKLYLNNFVNALQNIKKENS